MPATTDAEEPVQKRTHSIDVGGEIRIHATEKGTANTGPVVLLLHGLGVGSLYWDLPVQGYSTMDYLTGRGLRVYAIDHRGYGRSSSVPGDGVRAENVVDDISSVIDFIREEAAVDRICLVGHSWGGMVAVMVAAKRRECLHSLVLMSMPYSRLPPAYLERTRARPQSAAAVNGWIPNEGHLTLQERLYSFDPEVLQSYQEIVSSNYPRVPLGIIADVAALPHAASVPSIECPTLTIFGSLEQVVDPLDAVSMLEDLNVAQKDLIIVGNVGHQPLLERLAHARVDRAIADWALEHRRGGRESADS